MEAAGFYRAVGDADDHPDRAELQGGAAQVAPDESADQETEQRRNEVEDFAFLGAQVVADQRGDVDAHERKERAEVEEIRALIVGDDEGTDEGDDADKDDVVAWDVVFGIERAEEFFGNTVAASHAVEQARRAELRAHAGADIGDQDGEVDELEEKKAAGGLRDERERRR